MGQALSHKRCSSLECSLIVLAVFTLRKATKRMPGLITETRVRMSQESHIRLHWTYVWNGLE